MLEQQGEGQYRGEFVITEIRASSYSSGGRLVIEIRARLDSMVLGDRDALTAYDNAHIDTQVGRHGHDYASLGTTLGPHPLTLLRPELTARRLMSSKDLKDRRHGQPVRIAGLVVGRQQPGTASGVTFVTLEDEYGMVNVVVWRTLAERQLRELVASQQMRVDGTIEMRDGVLHVVAGRLQDISELLQGLDTRSRDLR